MRRVDAWREGAETRDTGGKKKKEKKKKNLSAQNLDKVSTRHLGEVAMPCLSGPQWHLTTGDGEPPHSIMSNSIDPRRVAVLTPAGALFEASGDGRLQACAPLASAGSGTSGAGGDGGELTSGIT